MNYHLGEDRVSVADFLETPSGVMEGSIASVEVWGERGSLSPTGIVSRDFQTKNLPDYVRNDFTKRDSTGVALEHTTPAQWEARARDWTPPEDLFAVLNVTGKDEGRFYDFSANDGKGKYTENVEMHEEWWRRNVVTIAAAAANRGFVSFTELDGGPSLTLYLKWYSSESFSHWNLRNVAASLHFQQIRSFPVTYSRVQPDSAEARDAARAGYFSRITQFSNVSSLQGSELISFVQLLKMAPLYGVALRPFRVGSVLGMTVPLPRFIRVLQIPPSKTIPEAPDNTIMLDQSEPYLGYHTVCVTSYILAIEALFAQDVIARAADKYLSAIGSAKYLTDRTMVEQDFYDKANYVHAIDDLINAPINVTVKDRVSGAPLHDVSVFIPEVILDTRPVGTPGRRKDGMYYPRARIKEIYTDAMKLALAEILKQSRTRGVDISAGFRVPTTFGLALSKVDIPKTGGTLTEDTVKKFVLLSLAAGAGAFFLSGK